MAALWYTFGFKVSLSSNPKKHILSKYGYWATKQIVRLELRFVLDLRLLAWLANAHAWIVLSNLWVFGFRAQRLDRFVVYGLGLQV